MFSTPVLKTANTPTFKTISAQKAIGAGGVGEPMFTI